MAEKGAPDPLTQAVLSLARRQHSIVARAQLAELGVSDDWLRTRTAAGWLARVHRGVYAIGGTSLIWRGRWMAAVLACGKGALLSHSSAAALWRLAPPAGADIEVTVRGRGGRGRRPGLQVHRPRNLTEGDATVEQAIPVTSPVRTLIDLAASGIERRPLERILDEAERLRLLDPAAFVAGVRGDGEVGSGSSAGAGVTDAEPCPPRLPALLRSVLSEHEAGSTLTRSELEERFLALCRERDLPAPLVNAELLGLTVDFLWPAAALVVELDGRAAHDTHRAFQDDRDRDGLLIAAGFRTMRFTWRDVPSRPGVVVHRLRRAIGG